MALRKCACIDTLYTELPWLERFQAAKNDGFEAVEFWDWRVRDLDATREAAEKAGIAISGFNRGCQEGGRCQRDHSFERAGRRRHRCQPL